jgi:uncharacterized protein YjbI with pentapeptide repeats
MLAVPSVLLTTTSASADTVVNGCTIVSNPTSTNFTNCPGVDFTGANLSGVDLSFANLAGAVFVGCNLNTGPCGGADLTGANLTDANLTNTTMADCQVVGAPRCDDANLQNAVLAGVNLTDAVLASCSLTSFLNAFCGEPPAAFAGEVNLSGADLTDATVTGATLGACLTSDGNLGPFEDCGGATLTGANLTGVNLTGIDLSGTSLVPSPQTVFTTNSAGAVVSWPTPPSLSGATPGSCTPPSGSTLPVSINGPSAVSCQVVDGLGDVTTGTFVVVVNFRPPPTTSVLVPSDGAVLAGAPYLDAAASSPIGHITSVTFEVSGNGLTNQIVATGSPTLYGYLAKWNTTSVANGTYSLQSAATNTSNDTATSAPITITVNNQPPTTAVLIPSDGASVSGANALLDASASSAVGLASVTFEVSGNGLSDQVVATGTPTLYGYLAQWNTTAVPNGTYTLQSVATDTVAESTTSAPVSVTVDNAPPTTAVLIPSNGATQSGTTALLDASASPGVTSVTYELTGGTLTNQVIATGTPTLYGWLAQWNTTSVPNGTYTLQSVASYAGGVSGTSAPVTITVAPVSLADLAGSFTNGTEASLSGCSFVGQTLGGGYTDNSAVGTVTLQMNGCIANTSSNFPFILDYSGAFHIATGVGTLDGTVGGQFTDVIEPPAQVLPTSGTLTLTVTSGTGEFAGTTGTLNVALQWPTPGSVPFEGTVTVG